MGKTTRRYQTSFDIPGDADFEKVDEMFHNALVRLEARADGADIDWANIVIETEVMTVDNFSFANYGEDIEEYTNVSMTVRGRK